MTEMASDKNKTCNRLPGHSLCARKINNHKCPTGGDWCHSRQNGDTFNPITFFAKKKTTDTAHARA